MRRLTVTGTCVLLLASWAPTSGGAVEFKHSEPPFVPSHHCTCRFMGETVELGGRRCLMTPQGPRTAECVMEQNVTSWRPSGEACPQASLPQTRG